MRKSSLSALVLASALAMPVWAGGPVQNTPAQDVRTIGHEALAADANLERHPASILVQFDTNAPAAQHRMARALVSGTTVRAYTIVPGLEQLGISMNVDQAIALLNATPGVIYAEPDYVLKTNNTPNDEFFNLQWGIHNTGQNIQGVNGINDADIDGIEAWDTSTGDADFVIAIIDTGTQWNHPDLDANIWSNPGEVVNGVDDDGNGLIDDVRGWDFWDNDSNPTDGSGHGTHTAGTVGAEGNNSIGVAGVNWQCELMPLRFLGPNGGFTSGAISCVQYAHDMNVKVSNNSWGGGGFSNSLYNAINATKSVGHLFVAAAGNSNQNTDSSPHYPSSYNLDNIISVAATDNRDNRASFSNYGANSVDLGAPGVDIASTYTGNGYVWNSGTSMACPHVAGVAGLVYAQNPGWTYQQVRDQIFNSVRPVSSMDGITVTGGVLNANDALDGGGSGNTPPTVTISSPGNNTTVTEGDNVTFTGSANDDEDGNITASIVWTSNLQGQIGTGGSFNRDDLVVGVHSITASVTDADGDDGTDGITLNVQSSNSPPSVSISSPGNNTTVTEGDSVTFTGSASDLEDGVISGDLVWTSNLQGQIGTGASFSTSALIVGDHVITASVTDSDGASGDDTVNVSVEEDGGNVTPPDRPDRPSLQNLGGGNVRVTWGDNSDNEEFFEVQRQERVGRQWNNTTIVGTVGANVTSLDDAPGTGRFRYRVRAGNSAGTSSWSSWRAIRIR